MADKGVIDKFIHEYSYSKEYKTQQEWADQYGVSRQTLQNWIYENKERIDKIQAENLAELDRSLQKAGQDAVKVLSDQIWDEDKRISQGACKTLLEYVMPKKSTSDINLNTDEQPTGFTVAIKSLENTNVSGKG